ncbi:MAG: methyl-accepting chemotaxis protein [Anaerolineae bacterium]|nr:methyl-accepting chemotaxis protein [Anaerolineae bacterium]MDQ7037193.1 methyl-accepting chemotaxis protein [Anaerolineae bacterium]
MTKVSDISQTTRASRLGATLSHRLVLMTIAATFLPTFLTLLTVFWLEPTLPVGLWLIAPLAFIAGIVLGLYNQNIGYHRTAEVLRDYTRALDKVADGDLRTRLTIPPFMVNNKEAQMLAHLGWAMNRTLDTMQTVVQDFSQALSQLDTDTQAILDATSRQIKMGHEQDAVVTETTATVNEVRATVTETAERAQSVAETAQISVDISRTGTEAVRETVDGMEVIRRQVEDIADNILVLSEHTQQIGEIIATVNNLADQSRMLALNASVEAARAGEEGKGFAVVAMEVRNLADQNRDATIQVREILGEIQRATNSAVMVTEEGSKGVDVGQQRVNKAGDSINELSRAIEDAAMAAMQIAASTRQQTIGMDQLTDAMRTIKHATTETVSSTMQVESSVSRLRDAAERVNNVLAGLQYQD